MTREAQFDDAIALARAFRHDPDLAAEVVFGMSADELRAVVGRLLMMLHFGNDVDDLIDRAEKLRHR